MSTPALRRLTGPLLLCGLLLAAGCGKKGPLYHPDRPSEQKSAPAAEPPASTP